MSAETETFTYTLHCHCRAHVLTLHSIPSLQTGTAITCNCSICTDRGVLLAFVPKKAIEFQGGLRGEEGLPTVADSLSSYSFGKHTINWRFCKTCGSNILGVGVDTSRDVWGINLRCVDGVDLKNLKLMEIDGKSL